MEYSPRFWKICGINTCCLTKCRTADATMNGTRSGWKSKEDGMPFAPVKAIA
jgi:hypothetical protein